MGRWAAAGRTALIGYVAGAVLGYLLVLGFSSNQHDKSIEATMTAAFASGPLGALIGFVAGLLVTRGVKKP